MMRSLVSVWMVAAVLISMVGCARVTTKVVEKPRVDQEIQGGNRGYLVGSPSAPANRKSTRQMIQTDIELPTMEELNPWRKSSKPSASVPATQPEESTAMIEPSAESEEWYGQEEIEVGQPKKRSSASVAGGTTYKVKNGDTLQKISQKFYGTTRKWPQIYEANRNVLRSPNNVRVGQTLVIPSLGETSKRNARVPSDIK